MSLGPPRYFDVPDVALISFTGEDAAAFLHAQLTSDVAGMRAPASGYSGYCSPKGRLLATFLLWRLEGEILLQLPASLRESIQARIAKYVLRAKVKVADATSRYSIVGISGEGAAPALSRLFDGVPSAVHQVAGGDAHYLTAIPVDRYVLLARTDSAERIRARLDSEFARGDASGWPALEVAAGVPIITAPAQDEYVPQMVNLDLLGGVSFNKGCYPGQEIVARMHYLGRLKQRMYRIRIPGAAVATGEPLYSPAFGAQQASGTILYGGAVGEALAVIQKAAVDARELHYSTPDGAQVEVLSLPYSIPD